jgi:hypothetical protein
MNSRPHLIRMISVAMFLLLAIAIRSYSQPTGYRDFAPQRRAQFTKEKLEELRAISRVIDRQPKNVDNYVERLRLYRDLLECNYDNPSWDKFADGYASDLSRSVELENTSRALVERADFMRERLLHSSPTTFSGLYQSRFFKTAFSDLTKALEETSDVVAKQVIYLKLGDLDALRADFAISASFAKSDRALNLIRTDLKLANEKIDLSWGLPWDKIRFPYFMESIVYLYIRIGGSYFKLKDYQTAISVHTIAQKRLDSIHPAADFSKCDFYAGWAHAMLLVDRHADVDSKLANIPKSSMCDELKEVRDLP